MCLFVSSYYFNTSNVTIQHVKSLGVQFGKINFNTSNVTIQLKSIKSKSKRMVISIHLMLLFNGVVFTAGVAPTIFQYI